MRIERVLATLSAVLCGVLSACGVGGAGGAERGEPGHPRPAHLPHLLNLPHTPHVRHQVQEDPGLETVGAWKRAKWQEMQTVLRKEGYTQNGSKTVECCPAVLEMIQPEGGRNQEGRFVELFRDGENKQRLYETSCREDVVNKPCRFVDPRLQNQSRCVQQYSFTYALVRKPGEATEAPHRHRRGEREGHFSSLPEERESYFSSLPGSGGWSLDYIKVRSGCVCEVEPPSRKKKRQERHRQKKMKGRRHDAEDDET